MRISDWSSDVCSSDLATVALALPNPESRIPNPAPKRIALCAGEASGDLLGAGLIEQLRARFPDAQFAGIGGDAMRAAGFEAWHDAQELAVMGFAEVLAHLPRLLKLRRGFRRRVLDWKPDAFIRSEEHTSELQSLMRNSYAVFCLKKKNKKNEKSI